MSVELKKVHFGWVPRLCVLFLALFSVAVTLEPASMMAQPSAARPLALKMSSPFPPTEAGTRFFLPTFAKEVERVTEGRVKVTLYTSESLGKSADHYDMVRKGICDIAFSLPSFTSGLFPLSSVIELPFLGFQSGEEASQVLWELYKKFPEIRAEYKGTKVLTLCTTDPTQLWMRKKPVRVLSDFKGMRIRATGATTVQTLDLLGANPITMVAAEIYTSLEKGVLDGVLFSAAGVTGFKLQDIVKHGSLISAGVFQFFLLMNEEKWNGLPEDIREKIDRIAGESAATLAPRIGHDQAATAAYEVCKKAGIDIYSIPDDELARWKNAVSAIYDNWAKDKESKGLPGRAILNEAVRLAKKGSTK